MHEIQVEEESILKRAKLFDYKLKFSVDNFSGAFNNDILITRYQPFTGSLPVTLSGSDAFNGLLKASVFDLFEDIRFTGATSAIDQWYWFCGGVDRYLPFQFLTD